MATVIDKIHPVVGGIYIAISYALAQFAAVTLRAKRGSTHPIPTFKGK